LEDITEAVGNGSISDRQCYGPWPSRSLERALIVISICLGFVHTWAGRYSMSPDGISYLDVGSAFFRADWRGAFNAYWSPVYAWVLGGVVGSLKPSPKWEFPLVHAVNFVIFLVALVAFRFFLRSLWEYSKLKPAYHADQREGLPEWSYILLGYAIFWWCILELTPIYEVTPDLAVSACMCLAIGLLLRARQNPTPGRFGLLGLVLAVGYWVKAALFPLAIVFLAVTYLWNRRSLARSLVGVAGLAFLVAAAPLIIALSIQKHRFTFGDSGRLNYAWAVAPRTFWRNWQGEETGSGKPLHPTRQLLRSPRLFVFEGPVIGTYPPWLDPSYWNEGLQWHFSLRGQLEVLASNLLTEVSLLLRAQSGLLTGVIILGFLSGAGWLATLRDLWPLIVVPLAAFAMYAPVHVEPRFLGGFVLLVFLTLVAASRFRRTEGRIGGIVALAIFITMAIGTVDTGFRYLTHRLAIPGSGPNSVLDQVTVANQIRQMGLSSGDKVAIIGDGTDAYWARLAGVRIVAEIMGAYHDEQHFWQSSEATKQVVFKTFSDTGAKLLVADNPPEAFANGWIHLEGTTFYIRPLGDNSIPQKKNSLPPLDTASGRAGSGNP
jgi:hypothetical protein